MSQAPSVTVKPCHLPPGGRLFKCLPLNANTPINPNLFRTKKAGIAHPLASFRRLSTLFRAEPSESRKKPAGFLRPMFAPDFPFMDSRRVLWLCKMFALTICLPSEGGGTSLASDGRSCVHKRLRCSTGETFKPLCTHSPSPSFLGSSSMFACKLDSRFATCPQGAFLFLSAVQKEYRRMYDRALIFNFQLSIFNFTSSSAPRSLQALPQVSPRSSRALPREP